MPHLIRFRIDNVETDTSGSALFSKDFPMRWIISLCALGCMMTALPAEDKKPAFDASQIEGKWTIISGTNFGKKVEGDALKGEVIVTKDTITIKSDITHVMTYKLDSSASPIAITMVGKEGPSAGFTSEGIIELKGDELKLCYAMPMEKRPTSFTSDEKSKSLLFILKQAK
jgi:uncharacterized protein (TIGR03067 family)